MVMKIYALSKIILKVTMLFSLTCCQKKMRSREVATTTKQASQFKGEPPPSTCHSVDCCDDAVPNGNEFGAYGFHPLTGVCNQEYTCYSDEIPFLVYDEKIVGLPSYCGELEECNCRDDLRDDPLARCFTSFGEQTNYYTYGDYWYNYCATNDSDDSEDWDGSASSTDDMF